MITTQPALLEQDCSSDHANAAAGQPGNAPIRAGGRHRAARPGRTVRGRQLRRHPASGHPGRRHQDGQGHPGLRGALPPRDSRPRRGRHPGHRRGQGAPDILRTGPPGPGEARGLAQDQLRRDLRGRHQPARRSAVPAESRPVPDDVQRRPATHRGADEDPGFPGHLACQPDPVRAAPRPDRVPGRANQAMFPGFSVSCSSSPAAATWWTASAHCSYRATPSTWPPSPSSAKRCSCSGSWPRDGTSR